MKMIAKLSLVFGILMLLLTGCDKTTDGKWMVYEETVCYPYWVHTSNDNKTKDQLESFLKDDGIIPLKIRVLGEREITCEACACLTGKRYEVLVDKSQIGYNLSSIITNFHRNLENSKILIKKT